MRAAWRPGALGGAVLRVTDLDEVYVLSLALAVVLAVVAALRIKPSARTLVRSLAAAGGASAAALLALAAIHFPSYQRITEEDHLIEWLSALFLLAGWVVGLAAAVRLARRRTPSPLAVFLAAGLFVAFWRELEWGQPFLGDKLWYSRNVFRLRAYVRPDYFERFAATLALPNSPAALRLVHLTFSGMLIVLSLAVLLYLLRHHRAFSRELRALFKAPGGRELLVYAAAGAILYAGSQVLGWCFRHCLNHPLAAWRDAYNVSHRIVDEPLEMLGAACFMASAIAMHLRWRPPPLDRAEAELPAPSA